MLGRSLPPPGRQVRPSKSQNTGPRQYSCPRGGDSALNFTRKAIESDVDRLLIDPGDMLSERPVMPEYASCGRPHSGPCTRGKRKNSSSITGLACSSRLPAVRRLSFIGRVGAAAPDRLAVTISTVTSISAAVWMVCE